MKYAGKTIAFFYFVCLLKLSVGHSIAPKSSMDSKSQNVEEQLMSALSNGEMDKARTLIKGGALDEYLSGKSADHRRISLEKVELKLRSIEQLLTTGIAVLSDRKNNISTLRMEKSSFQVVLLPGTNFIITLKIDEAAVKSWGNKSIRNGRKPLHIISMLPDVPPEIVQIVLDNSADGINVKTNTGATPLLFSATTGNLDLTKFLVEKGASINDFVKGSMEKAYENSYNEYLRVLSNKKVENPLVQYHYSPLVAAVWEDHIDILKYLIKKGADITSGGQEWGVLFNAVLRGKRDIVEILLQNGIDVNAQDVLGQTALHRIVVKGDIEMAKFLLENRASVTVTDIHQWTPFHAASFSSDQAGRAMIQLLTEAGSDVSARQDGGYSPLSLLLAGSHKDFLKYLVDHFESLNSTSRHGVLVEADSSDETVRISKYMIEGGANFNGQDDVLGYSPLHWAAASGDLKMAKALQPYGPVVSLRSKMGLNPLETAVHFNRKLTADYLKTVKELVL